MKNRSEKRVVAIPLTRVQLLADVIFATSMTIMVLNFDMPGDSEIGSESDLLNFFAEQRDALLTYVISFLLVFIYWMKHPSNISATSRRPRRVTCGSRQDF